MGIFKSNRPVLVFGKNGQLASSLARTASAAGDFVFVGSDEVDLRDSEALQSFLAKHPSKIIINAAAYTQVDRAETEKEAAFQINAIAPQVMAKHCADRDGLFIHFSTDYVFNGLKPTPYIEADECNPLGVYGESKRDGEERILALKSRAFIFRTSWVYSPFGGNFVKTMLRLGAERDTLKVVSDQVGNPTSAHDLALAMHSFLAREVAAFEFPGVYHLTGEGSCSWYEFAKEIFAQAHDLGFSVKLKNLLPIPTQEYPTPAQRPMNSRLSNDKAVIVLGMQLPKWKSSLKICLENINANR